MRAEPRRHTFRRYCPPTSKNASVTWPSVQTRAASAGENVFAVLMDAARVCSLGQVTEAFFEVGGAYRRNV